MVERSSRWNPSVKGWEYADLVKSEIKIKRMCKVKGKVLPLMIQSAGKVLGIFDMYEKDVGIWDLLMVCKSQWF